MRVFFVLLLGGALAMSLARNASAQTSTGSIRGYVTDSSGTPVAGARVIAVNASTSAQREVPTQSNGFYTIVGLVPAEYDVTARQIGMAAQKAHVRVLIAEVFPLDFKLGRSAVQLEAVTIAAAAGVEAQTSEVATSVTPQQMRAMPSASHNFLDLAALAPGVSVAPDFANLGSSNAGVTDKSFSYGAQGPGQVNVFIDGASLKNDLTGGESGIHGGTFGQDASRGNPFPRGAHPGVSRHRTELQGGIPAIIRRDHCCHHEVWGERVVGGRLFRLSEQGPRGAGFHQPRAEFC